MFARLHTNPNLAYAMQTGFMLLVLFLLRWYRQRRNQPPTALDQALTALLFTLPLGLLLFLIAAVVSKP